MMIFLSAKPQAILSVASSVAPLQSATWHWQSWYLATVTLQLPHLTRLHSYAYSKQQLLLSACNWHCKHPFLLLKQGVFNLDTSDCQRYLAHHFPISVSRLPHTSLHMNFCRPCSFSALQVAVLSPQLTFVDCGDDDRAETEKTHDFRHLLAPFATTIFRLATALLLLMVSSINDLIGCPVALNSWMDDNPTPCQRSAAPIYSLCQKCDGVRPICVFVCICCNAPMHIICSIWQIFIFSAS